MRENDSLWDEFSVPVIDQLGINIRIVKIDGRHLAVTSDFSSNRVNVAVEDGTIVELVDHG